MEGVRLSGIDGNVSQRHIELAFIDRGIQIKRIYYPLHNNEAVVLFKDSGSTVKVLCERLEALRYNVHPLPHKIFAKVSVELEATIAPLLSDSDTRRKLKQRTGERVKFVEKDGCTTLEGDLFDIELASNFLSQEIEEQFSLENTQNGHDPSLASVKPKSRRSVQDTETKYSRSQGRTTVAEGIQSSAHTEDHDQHLSIGPDIPPGKGFSLSRVTSVEETGRGGNSRDADASRTFEEFSSLQSENQHRLENSSLIRKELLASKKNFSQESGGEVRGASGGRRGSPSHVYREGKNGELLSFSSTYAADASILQELHNNPEVDLEAIRKWVGMPESLQNERGSDSTDELLQQTHPMSLQNGQKRTDESSVNARSTNGVKESQYETASSSKRYLSSDISDDTKNFEFKLPGNIMVKVHYGDIVKSRTEGIVNAANWELKHYGGVAGALERACGSTMQSECDRYIAKNGRMEVSEVMHTNAGNLASYGTRYILHAVGPIFLTHSQSSRSGKELIQTFLRCLVFANQELHIKSITFPFISTGVYGIPVDICVESFLDALVLYADSDKSDSELKEIHLVNTDLEMIQTAIVMLNQHLEQSFEMLLAKAKSKIRSNSTAHHDRSPRSESRTASVRRSSSLTRAEQHRLSEHRNLGTGSLRLEDFASRDEVSSPKLPSPRPRSGSLDVSKNKSSEKTRPMSASSSETKKSPKSLKPDLKMTSKYMNAQGPGLSFKTSSASGQSRTGPMRATSQFLSPFDDEGGRDSSRLRHTYSGDKYSSLPSDINEYKKGRPLPIPSALSKMDDEECSICKDTIVDPHTLEKCGHVFCKPCIKEAFKQKPVCPVCGHLYGTVTGDQPRGGKMSHTIFHDVNVPGYKGARGAIAIEYYFPGGYQQEGHPNPGRRYAGIKRTAYLPNNTEGREVLRLLEKAFKAGVTFTIGDSRTTGHQGVITWNDIHHKTSLTGGSENYGYPDPDYLKRVKEELAAKGITS